MRSMALCNCCHSYSSSCPLRSLLPEISASIEMRREANCRLDISNEKMAIDFLKSVAAFLANDSTKEVFPIPGLAARMIKSLGCQPDVIRSRAVKPVGTPVRPSVLPRSSSNCFSILLASEPMLS